MEETRINPEQARRLSEEGIDAWQRYETSGDKALKYFALKHLEKAYRVYKKLYSENPKKSEHAPGRIKTTHDLAIHLMKGGDYQKADQHFKELLNLAKIWKEKLPTVTTKENRIEPVSCRWEEEYLANQNALQQKMEKKLIKPTAKNLIACYQNQLRGNKESKIYGLQVLAACFTEFDEWIKKGTIVLHEEMAETINEILEIKTSEGETEKQAYNRVKEQTLRDWENYQNMTEVPRPVNRQKPHRSHPTTTAAPRPPARRQGGGILGTLKSWWTRPCY